MWQGGNMSSSFGGISKGKDKLALVKPGLNQGPGFAQGPASNRIHTLAGNGVHFGSVDPIRSELGSSAFDMTADESQRFLRIIRHIAQIRHQY